MAANNNKPAKRESQPPKKGAGSPNYSLNHNRQVAFDPITARVMMQSLSGPLPSGSEYAHYEQTLPGSANRILCMAEKEQDARLDENKERLKLDEKIIKGHKWRSGFAQIAAFILVLVAFYVSYDLTMHGHETAGIAIATTTIGSILIAFLGARSNKTQEKEEED